VEYALILVLVAIVVIAALMILGPKIGGIFSKVNSSLSGIGSGVVAPVPTACTGSPAACGYVSCAQDGGNCMVSGVHNIAYGANGTYAYINGVNGSFTCLPLGYSGAYPTLPVSDPVPGVVKTCYIQ
jgi:Flp pilus assembly pilin Flp